jgi:hypothetical protein
VCVETESESDNDSIDNDVDDENNCCSTVFPTSSAKLTTVNGLVCDGGDRDGGGNSNGSSSKSSDYNDTVDDSKDTILVSNTNTQITH